MRTFIVLFLMLVSLTANAADPKEDARAEFQRGNELAREEAWAEALGAFQRSHELAPHPSTLFNIAMCERVLGHYTRARDAFSRASSDDKLPPALASESKTYLAEIERIVARVTVEISPGEAGVAIDGRPVHEEARAGAGPVYVAGTRPSGAGEAVPARSFELLVDPGTRVFVLSRRGYRDVVRQQRFAPGSRSELKLELERLPALLRIESNVPAPVVTVDTIDVGVAPLEVSRPAGTYRVLVRKPGFVQHDTSVTVGPGDDTKVDAKLSEERIPITKRWWFWASAVGVVAGGVALTYALTRPEPSPPPYDGGSTGWVVGR